MKILLILLIRVLAERWQCWQIMLLTMPQSKMMMAFAEVLIIIINIVNHHHDNQNHCHRQTEIVPAAEV